MILEFNILKFAMLLTGNDPFSKNDVTSKSAMMGVGHHAKPYWECKNPNDLRKRTGNNKRKKKI